jgi:hypothetical protein
LVVVLGCFVLRVEAVWRYLVLRGVVEVRRSWVGRSSEVGWVQERMAIEGWRRGWPARKGNGMSTRLVKLTERETVGEEHQYVGAGPVYHG